jgi:hypothetical protein
MASDRFPSPGRSANERANQPAKIVLDVELGPSRLNRDEPEISAEDGSLYAMTLADESRTWRDCVVFSERATNAGAASRGSWQVTTSVNISSVQKWRIAADRIGCARNLWLAGETRAEAGMARSCQGTLFVTGHSLGAGRASILCGLAIAVTRESRPQSSNLPAPCASPREPSAKAKI